MSKVDGLYWTDVDKYGMQMSNMRILGIEIKMEIERKRRHGEIN